MASIKVDRLPKKTFSETMLIEAKVFELLWLWSKLLFLDECISTFFNNFESFILFL
jgi:hypothetical protein